MDNLEKTEIPGFYPGLYYQITEDINCIPKGVYLLEAVQDDSLLFRASHKAKFIITGGCADKFKRVSQIKALSLRTKLSDFIERYYALLSTAKTRRDVLNPLTICMLDPSIVGEMQ